MVKESKDVDTSSPKTKPDCTEKCPECQAKVCNHSADEAKLHLNTIIRKIREGKIVR